MKCHSVPGVPSSCQPALSVSAPVCHPVFQSVCLPVRPAVSLPLGLNLTYSRREAVLPRIYGGVNPSPVRGQPAERAIAELEPFFSLSAFGGMQCSPNTDQRHARRDVRVLMALGHYLQLNGHREMFSIGVGQTS